MHFLLKGRDMAAQLHAYCGKSHGKFKAMDRGRRDRNGEGVIRDSELGMSHEVGKVFGRAEVCGCPRVPVDIMFHEPGHKAYRSSATSRTEFWRPNLTLASVNTKTDVPSGGFVN